MLQKPLALLLVCHGGLGLLLPGFQEAQLFFNVIDIGFAALYFILHQEELVNFFATGLGQGNRTAGKLFVKKKFREMCLNELPYVAVRPHPTSVSAQDGEKQAEAEGNTADRRDAEQRL